jgi:hypothetical protein
MRVVESGASEDVWLTVRNSGIARCQMVDLPAIRDLLVSRSLRALAQYEAVRARAADLFVMQTTAEAKAPADATSASRARSTEMHQDGYQFRSPYRGELTAGIGFMATVELLGFPVVVEPRVLAFGDLAGAGRELIRVFGGPDGGAAL